MTDNKKKADHVSSTPALYAARLAALRRFMRAEKWQAILVSRPENRRYLSGYSAADAQLDESSGYLFITDRMQYLLTDFRYKIHAEHEASGFPVLIYTQGPPEVVRSLARKHRIKSLAFEDDFVTVRFFKTLSEKLISTELSPIRDIVQNLRMIKDEHEIDLIRQALHITEQALSKTWSYLEPGRTEIEVARFLERSMVELGAEGPAFPSIVASGPNAALPHAEPTSRPIRTGETIIFDCGAQYKGYKSDISRTIILGEPEPWIKKIYSVVRQAQRSAIEAARPGMGSNELDAVARNIIVQAGYGEQFGHGLGHGVGLATHEPPSLSIRKPTILKPGMIVTIEPGIYLEGRGGVRLEQLIAITGDGCRLLNQDRTFYDWPLV